MKLRYRESQINNNDLEKSYFNNVVKKLSLGAELVKD